MRDRETETEREGVEGQRERQGAGTDESGAHSTGHPFIHITHVLSNPLTDPALDLLC